MAVDIINEILEQCIEAYPVSPFVISLYQQYQKRGSLSKKQLQGLYGKASKIKSLPPAKLATLEAIINKMATRYKSDETVNTPVFKKDEASLKLIMDVLHYYPEHKRVLFLKAKHDNNEPLSPTDLHDLKRFHEMVTKKHGSQ